MLLAEYIIQYVVVGRDVLSLLAAPQGAEEGGGAFDKDLALSSLQKDSQSVSRTNS